MKNEPLKTDGKSLNISADSRNMLKQIFPAIFSEIKNDKGGIVEAIDFEKLKAELGVFTESFENRRERYGMDWPGKKEALRLIQTPSRATLKPSREESVNFDTTENLFIEGDNLEVLKLLQKSYYGRVKMIYIDPPYNTGREFIYPDNYSESLETYLEYAGLIDGEGKKFSTNTANEGRFHTKWLNMMYPRLYLARNLLQDDGMIFISIDDNELSNLRKLCDEIFGEEHFIGLFIVNSSPSAIDYGHIAKMHDYVLFYAKDLSGTITSQLHEENKEFKYSDKIGPFNIYPLYNGNVAFNPDTRPNLYYPFYLNPASQSEDGFYEIGLDERKGWVKVYPVVSKKDGIRRVWRWGRDKSRKDLNQEIVGYKTEDGEFRVVQKTRHTGKVIRSLQIDKDISTRRGTAEVEEIFGKKIFPFPKPIELIKRFVSVATQEEDIVLDFFAGSATSAHAILDINKHEKSKRKFILVQLPEPCAPDSEAFKEGYKTIADISKERIRRVIKKLSKEQKDELDLDQFGEQDRGFKVLKLDKSNFKQWRELPPASSQAEITKQLEMHIDHIDKKASQEDLLFELLLKSGFMPTQKVVKKKYAGKVVFSVAEGALLICLENSATKELADAVIAENPQQFICLDSAFGGNDQLKANIAQSFAAHNMQKEKHNQIVFKTV